MAPKQVVVIGAGPSGLITLRHMTQFPDEFVLTSYEKNKDVGGLWNYSDDTDTDEYGLPSYASMYKTLRINLPKEMMQYPGFPFPDDLPSFPHYSAVKKYLTDFTEQYQLRKYIQFQTYVTNVTPEVSQNESVKWHVTTRDLVTNKTSTSIFDIAIVCNGTEGLPIMPDIPGEERFRGKLLHSKNFRDPADYRGKVILLLGVSYSGADIIFETAKLVPKMYVSHRREAPLEYKLPDNVQEVACIREIVPDGAILQNGDHVTADVIIYATGYHYNYPFLSAECGLTWKDDRIQPLYRHMFNIRYPSLILIGIVKQVLEFQLAHMQAQYACAVLTGKLKLPPEAEMLADEEADYQERVVVAKRHDKMAHDLFGPALWVYGEKISREGNFPNFTPGIIKFFDYISILYDTDFDTLKDREYRLIGDHDFEEL